MPHLELIIVSLHGLYDILPPPLMAQMVLLLRGAFYSFSQC